MTASTSQPMYGKCADMFGRRICFLFATGSYLIGAVLCGAAQSMIMLIVARALCGLGIGAFDTLMKIVVAGALVLSPTHTHTHVVFMTIF